MPRYIDAEKIDFGKVFGGESDFARDIRDAANSLISEVPTADVAPVVRAHWNDAYSPMGEMGWKFACSVCNGWAQVRTKFCAHCGAKMDGWQP